MSPPAAPGRVRLIDGKVLLDVEGGLKDSLGRFALMPEVKLDVKLDAKLMESPSRPGASES